MDIYTYIHIDPSIHRPNLLCDAANISLNGFEDCSRWRQHIAPASRQAVLLLDVWDIYSSRTSDVQQSAGRF